MVYIKERLIDGQSVAIQVDGVLDSGSIPLLKNVCDKHARENRRIFLHLEGLVHVCREGIDFLQEIQEGITLLNPPWLLRLKMQEPGKTLLSKKNSKK